MKKFDYKSVAKEIGWNFSSINPTVETKTKFNYLKEVVNAVNESTKMLDIGCGSAEKLLRYCGEAKEIIAIDYEEEMLKKAEANKEKYYTPVKGAKFKFVQMNADNELNFEDEEFDLVISRHCGGNLNEIHRILKEKGIFISEDISKYDCQELKNVFNRGQEYLTESPKYETLFKKYLDLNYEVVKFYKIEQIE